MLWSGLLIPICSGIGGTVVKRTVDIVVSAVLLLLALPVLLVASIVIRCTSPGPVLFRQVRMGRGFRPFEILKLRTMAHAQAGLAYTLGHDPRITPFGKWLRRTKLDELPQLWNVLRGDMSLVGPRPVLPELTEEFHEDYALLLRVRPGLTDPASLKYSQEARLLAQTSDPMQFFKTVLTPDKIRISCEYLEQANLWTDSVTIAMTAVICCFPTLSRVYGELPEVPELLGSKVHPRQAAEKVDSAHVAALRVQSAMTTANAHGAVNQSAFAYELAYLEAAVEDASKFGSMPWFLLQNPDFESQSASTGRNGSASRL